MGMGMGMVVDDVCLGGPRATSLGGFGGNSSTMFEMGEDMWPRHTAPQIA